MSESVSTGVNEISIGGRVIGTDQPPYIIAEIGANHNGDMALAKRLIDAGKQCGVDAVKFQSWSKSSLISRAEYARNTRYVADKNVPTLEKAVEQYQLTPAQHVEVADYCQKQGITFLSSCFSVEEVDLLTSLNVPAFKIASMDVNHLPLLDYVASKNKPVILSTGMATLGEVERAVRHLQRGGCPDVILLHCISIYPAPPEQINLRNIAMLRHAFGLPTGFSDHTLGTAIPLAAVALGACMIEKHFTLDHALEGWDHAISADPAEMSEIVIQSKNVFNALGSGLRVVDDAQIEKRRAFRRRMVAKRCLNRGEMIAASDVDFKRPGTGIGPDELSVVVGRILTRDIAAEDELEWSDFR